MCLNRSQTCCGLATGGNDPVASAHNNGVGGNDPPLEEPDRERSVGGDGDPESARSEGVS